MKAKIFRILGVIGLILTMGSLSACFDAHYPGYRVDPPAYSYGSPAYAYPVYHPQYVPAPRYYVYNPRPHTQYRPEREHEEHEWHEHHHHPRLTVLHPSER
jgi:hypothetical protein